MSWKKNDEVKNDGQYCIFVAPIIINRKLQTKAHLCTHGSVEMCVCRTDIATGLRIVLHFIAPNSRIFDSIDCKTTFLSDKPIEGDLFLHPSCEWNTCKTLETHRDSKWISCPFRNCFFPTQRSKEKHIQQGTYL